MNTLRIGIAGLGKISGIYLQNLTGMFARRVTVSAVTDLMVDRAAEIAAQYQVKHSKDIDALVNDPEVDIVLNITPPAGHYDVALRAVKAGKHVYNEKPLCITRDEAAALLKLAAEKNVRVGCAPDTFLGAGLQTCRKVIDDGWIGRPVAATATMMDHGPEHWHPNPEFFYKTGGGPMFDVGPYYVTALVNLLGPVTRVSGSVQKGFATRTVTSEPLYGTVINVAVPTHIAGTLDFASGVVGTITTSFDVWSHSMPPIEIYGTEGTLQVPDPNTFGGVVRVKRFRAGTWAEFPLINAYAENSRGLGVADMAESILAGTPHRASGELACHVLEIMHGIHDASASETYYHLKTTCARPDALGH
jgi:predicted dehydrogenase